MIDITSLLFRQLVIDLILSVVIGSNSKTYNEYIDIPCKTHKQKSIRSMKPILVRNTPGKIAKKAILITCGMKMPPYHLLDMAKSMRQALRNKCKEYDIYIISIPYENERAVKFPIGNVKLRSKQYVDFFDKNVQYLNSKYQSVAIIGTCYGGSIVLDWHIKQKPEDKLKHQIFFVSPALDFSYKHIIKSFSKSKFKGLLPFGAVGLPLYLLFFGSYIPLPKEYFNVYSGLGIQRYIRYVTKLSKNYSFPKDKKFTLYFTQGDMVLPPPLKMGFKNIQMIKVGYSNPDKIKAHVSAFSKTPSGHKVANHIANLIE